MFYLNKGTEQQSGSGHPWTDNFDYLFVNRTGFTPSTGLPKVPLTKLPSGQFHCEAYGTFVAAALATLDGQGGFSAAFPIDQAAFEVVPITKNGETDWFAWSVLDDYVQVGSPSGRYLIQLVLSDGVTQKYFYSEEFLVQNCC